MQGKESMEERQLFLGSLDDSRQEEAKTSYARVRV